MAQERTIVVFCGKPSQSRAYAPVLGSRFPDDRLVFLHTMLQGPLDFCYPRGAKWASFPQTSEPQYHLAHDFPWLPSLYSQQDGIVRDQPIDPVAEIMAASLFICATDYDPSDLSGLELLFNRFRTQDEKAFCWFASSIKSLCPEAIEEVLDKNLNFWDVAESFRDAGMVKRYFDWNFNVNSQAVLAKTLRVTGPQFKNGTVFLSKYMLQLLYALQSGKSYGASELIMLMQDWTGTGKYNPRDSAERLGSAASRWQIVENLFTLGLVQAVGANPSEMSLIDRELQHKLLYSLSDTGARLLECLHPNCKDADLPFRLDQWCSEGLVSAKPKIDQYIKTFFGRQKRFLDKLGR